MIKLQALLKEKGIKLGKVYTDKDRPPFKVEEKLTEAKGKWAVINANDVLNIFPEKVVDTQKEAEKIAKQMKQKDRYGKYQAVSVKRWNQAGKGKKIKEGKLTEGKFKAKGKYLYMPDGEMSSIPKATDRDRLVIQIKYDKFMVYTSGKFIQVYGPYSRQFKNLNDLAKFLNKEKAKYIGID